MAKRALLVATPASAALVACASSVPAAGGRPAPPDAQAARIDALFRDVDHGGEPGGSIAVARQGKVILARGYGPGGSRPPHRQRSTTAFYVASIAKQVTALAVALLVHDGALAMDDDVRRYLPDVPDSGTPVHIADLVHHASGIRDDSLLSEYAGLRYGDLMTERDAFALIDGQREHEFSPAPAGATPTRTMFSSGASSSR